MIILLPTVFRSASRKKVSVFMYRWVENKSLLGTRAGSDKGVFNSQALPYDLVFSTSNTIIIAEMKLIEYLQLSAIAFTL